jgi:low affinity Fe/Cu permease
VKAPRKPAIGRFERFAAWISRASGSTPAFLVALAVVLAWAVAGPVFHFSETWQLVINTGTTIVTFLMVFLIQRSQNKESLAVQLKLNEIVAALSGASNRLVNVEDLGEEELGQLHAYYRGLAELAEKERNVKVSHSIEEAAAHHQAKVRARKRVS